jgi:hypothetical protein
MTNLAAVALAISESARGGFASRGPRREAGPRADSGKRGRRRTGIFPAGWLTQWNYCNSLVTSCWMLLAWARAEMPVWLRISYLDSSVVAEA